MSAQSSLPKSIEDASRSNSRLFFAYLIVLLVTVIFTYLLFKSGNNLQDAIRKDADARIKEAGAVADSAKADAAGANERAQKLENEAVALRIELSKQQEVTARALRELAEVKERQEPRRITAAQAKAVVPLLRAAPHASVMITSSIGDSEANALAAQFEAVLKEAGWGDVDHQWVQFPGTPPVGVGMAMQDAKTAGPVAVAFQQAFETVGIEILGAERPTLRPGLIELIVGRKP